MHALLSFMALVVRGIARGNVISGITFVACRGAVAWWRGGVACRGGVVAWRAVVAWFYFLAR